MIFGQFRKFRQTATRKTVHECAHALFSVHICFLGLCVPKACTLYHLGIWVDSKSTNPKKEDEEINQNKVCLACQGCSLRFREAAQQAAVNRMDREVFCGLHTARFSSSRGHCPGDMLYTYSLT